ncbi:MAG: ABC transporter permease [Lachnospiraceae bacterium]|nr:ABC transporter permease [Lachnospiraceae bacterium]
MQVFKLFFKILKSQLTQIIMYIVIFIIIAYIIAGSPSAMPGYSEQKQDISVVDEDGTQTSGALKDYLLLLNNQIELDGYDFETIQDELYNRNTTNVIFIPKGFEDAVLSGNTGEILDIYNIPGTMAASVVTGQADNFINILNSYIAAEMNLNDALNKTKETLSEKTDISFLSDSGEAASPLSIFLTYIAYVFITIAVNGVSPVIQVFNKPALRKRFNCSSYKMSRFNAGLIAGITIFGIAVCAIFTTAALFTHGSELLSVKGLLSILNMAVYMVVSLSIAYLIGSVSTNANIVSMLSNVIGLGFSFLGGVFVPLEFLGDGIIKIAHFLPSYWYIIAKKSIFNLGNGSTYIEIMQGMGIMLAFAAAIFTVTLAIIKSRRSVA